MRTIALAVAFASLAPAAAASPERSERRDPFAAYPDDVIECFVSPLQKVDVGALKVQGVVAGTASPRAMLVLPDGTSHFVRVGDSVGRSWGRVEAITAKGVVVLEEFRDGLGARHPKRTTLALR